MKRTKAPPLKRAAQNLILQRRKNKKKSQHEKAPRMITAYATEQKKSQQWLNSGEVLVITERRIEWQGKSPLRCSCSFSTHSRSLGDLPAAAGVKRQPLRRT